MNFKAIKAIRMSTSLFNFSHALLAFNISPASGKSVTITVWLHTVMKQLQL